MPRVKLTATSIPHLKTDRTQVDYFDSYLPGFGVRVTRGGTRTYIRQRIRLMQRWSRHLLVLVAQARRF